MSDHDSGAKAPDGEYEVGYGKPPKEGRFQKGKSGNPSGRPKGSPNFRTAIKKAFSEKVAIVENGKRKKISKLDAAAKQLANKAASGDPRVMDRLSAIAPYLDEDAATGAHPPLNEADEEVAEFMLERIRKALADEALKPKEKKK